VEPIFLLTTSALNCWPPPAAKDHSNCDYGLKERRYHCWYVVVCVLNVALVAQAPLRLQIERIASVPLGEIRFPGRMAL
jgi:hypothetical protein